MKKIALIGSTGSIGKQVLDVVRRHPEELSICALVSNSGGGAFEAQVAEFKPCIAVAASQNGKAALEAARAEEADIIFNAAGGFAGLGYSLAAIAAKKTLALANKETLVCGGDAVIRLAEKNGVDILPVDSEHSAIWQCLNFDRHKKVRRLIITASGGAFRDYTPEMLKGVTPEQALAHPTWKMGAKITVDSSTLMNKGYEVIEAHVLYGTPYADIETVIQPQSIIHSLAEFTDGSVMAQLSYPTMEVPIQLALSYPDRFDLVVKPMDFKAAFSLDFRPLVRQKYPLYDLALKCGEAGGVLPCVLNAADEEAVHAFLNGRIAFTDMYRVVDGAVQSVGQGRADSFEELTAADKRAREFARKIIDNI